MMFGSVSPHVAEANSEDEAGDEELGVGMKATGDAKA
jgi:hypothetical protein